MTNSMIRKNQGIKIKFTFEPGVLRKSFFIKKTRASLRRLSELFPAHPVIIEVRIFRNQASFLKKIQKNKRLTGSALTYLQKAPLESTF